MSNALDAIDLFAGPGGWDVAATGLGLDVLGIEIDKAACQTREAAGLKTLQADVSTLDPNASKFQSEGLIASPPCQTFSAAGRGSGRKDLDIVYEAIDAMYADPTGKRWEDVAARTGDARTRLVLEPLRYVLLRDEALSPYRWLAFEQVPTVLPVWERIGDVLSDLGYGVVVGKLSAEQYGVPQTRKRAVVIAKWQEEVRLPIPTHRAYSKGKKQNEGNQALLPWVSMSEALGRGIESDDWVYRSTTMPNSARRPIYNPAPTIAFGHDAASAAWIYDWPSTSALRVTVQEAACLQSFPADYPWQGTKTAVYRQIGDAIPPGLARAVLKEATK